jgi:hypothetical protein
MFHLPLSTLVTNYSKSFQIENFEIKGFEIKGFEIQGRVAIRPPRENPRMHGQGKFRR